MTVEQNNHFTKSSEKNKRHCCIHKRGWAALAAALWLFAAWGTLPGAAAPEETKTPASSESAAATPKPSVSASEPKASGAAAAAGTNTRESSEETSQREAPRTDSEGRPILGEGETGILMEAETGRVLLDFNSQKRMFPASTTKIMTALVALEAVERGEVSMEETVTITPEMLEGLSPDSSNMELKEGEVIAFEYLMKGLLIPSGNDAAMAIAYRLAGSPQAFVEKMNQKAQELGLRDTHFVNPHGLHDPEHYTTAADLAVMTRAAMQKEAFRDIVDIVHIKMPSTNKTTKERYYINTNGLLSTMRYTEYYYSKSIGVKTGRTTEAGNCLVSAAKDKGMELIGVIMNGKEIADSHKDSIRILDYGFEHFQLITPIQKGDMLGEVRVKQGAGGRDTVTLSMKESVSVVAPVEVKPEDLEIRPEIPEAIYAPFEQGKTVASAVVTYHGEELGRGEMVTDFAVERHILGPLMSLGEWLWGFWAVRLVVYALVLGILAFVVVLAVRLRKELKRAKSTRRRKRNYKPPQY